MGLADKDDRLIKGTDKKQERGRIQTITLKKPIVFNSNKIITAVIEIDHINYGLDKKTKALKKSPRTDFSLNDIEKFLALLDGEYIYTNNHKGRVSKFDFRVDCPVKGRFYGKEFIMFFDTNYDKPNEIYTITIYPDGW